MTDIDVHCGFDSFKGTTDLYMPSRFGYFDQITISMNLLKASSGSNSGSDFISRPTSALPIMSPEEKRSLIYELIDAAKNGTIDVLRRSRGKIEISEVKDYDKRTPLHLASAEGHIDIVKHLLEDWKADPRVLDRWGGTPYLDAVKGKHNDIVELLKKKMKSSKKNGVQDFDIIDAAFRGDVERLKSYFREGWDMSISDWDQRRPIHLAAAEGHLEAVKFLVEECDVDPSVEDRNGTTPFDEAYKLSNKSVANYLVTMMIKRLKLPDEVKDKIKYMG